MTNTARLSAIAVGLVAALSLVIQMIVSTEDNGGVFIALWVIYGYFTIITNTIVAVTFLRMGLTGNRLSAWWLGGVTLWILIVGIVYHVLLARLYDPQGLNWWSDTGLHTVVPIVTALWWIAFAPKTIEWIRAFHWLAWPAIYVVYALIRGQFTQTYPYFFIDLNELTPFEVLLNSIGLCIAFWIGGLIIVGIAKALSR